MTTKTEPRCVRRPADVRVAELEQKIVSIRARDDARKAREEVKASPDGVAFLAAVKAMDRALRVAGEAENDAMVRALEAGHAPMAEHLIGMGVRMPDRGARKRKGAAA
jgi:hypothetical protein